MSLTNEIVKQKLVEKFGDQVKRNWESIETFEYDKRGMITKSTHEIPRFDGKESVLKYDYKDGHLVEIKRTFDRKLTSRLTFLYNANGQIIERNKFDDKDKLLQRDRYRYEDGELSTITLYNADGKEIRYKSFITGNDGRTELIREPDGFITALRAYFYNDQNQLTMYGESNHTRTREGKLATTAYEYSAAGLKIKTIKTYEKSSEKIITNFSYDAQGNLTRETYLDNNPYTYAYTYDSHNNWVAKLMGYDALRNRETTYVLYEREVKY
ncbi:MAG: hypothetical protein EOO88_57565 [Pedobacter sp.]|nr:MAG: hypothetical protein EOO88_57565 [Pedobacter sp.]